MCETKLIVQYPNNDCGAWLTKDSVGCVFFEARRGQVFLAYSTNTKKGGLYDICLSFNKEGLELQYFGDNDDHKTITIDNTLAYNLLFDTLKKLEQKALELQPVKPVVK